MRITVIAVGKIKESFFRDAIAEYSKRLRRYCKLDILELEDEKTPERAGELEIRQIKRREGERILKVLKDDSYVIALAIDGKSLSSEKLAVRMEQLGIHGESHVSFVIGGSLGLDNEVLKKADLNLSFSDMTFPHQLIRVILLEQIYRSYRIIHGAPYHK